jgi:acetolactate decarboxylase
LKLPASWREKKYRSPWTYRSSEAEHADNAASRDDEQEEVILMKTLTVEIPDSTYESLIGGHIADDAAMSLLVSSAVTNYLHGAAGWINAPSYQLRETGRSSSAPISSIPLQYNDLGVGVTATRDKVVIIENRLFRFEPQGRAVEIIESVDLPYAMIVNFSAENLRNDFGASSIEELVSHCEALRAGKNVFYALRVDGTFQSITLRSTFARLSPDHAAETEGVLRTHRVKNIKGTLIGLWSSGFTSSACIPGYHFYFLSDERECGGAVVDCAAVGLRMLGMPVTGLRFIRPDTPDFRSEEMFRSNPGVEN